MLDPICTVWSYVSVGSGNGVTLLKGASFRLENLVQDSLVSIEIFWVFSVKELSLWCYLDACYRNTLGASFTYSSTLHFFIVSVLNVFLPPIALLED